MTGLGAAGRLRGGARFGAALIALLVAASLAAPWLAPRPPDAVDLARRLEPPSWSEPFGTDPFGRSVLARVLHGGRVSLLVGAVVVALGGGVGSLIGLTSGYLGGRAEGFAMRGADVLLSFPPLLLALAVIGVYGPGLAPTVAALILVEIPVFARLARGAVLPLRDAPFVAASRAAGARTHRTLLRHVLPAALPPLAAHASVAVGYAVLALAGLSFLGLGVQPPTPEWGGMIAEARGYLIGSGSAPWLLVFPSLAVASTVLGFVLLGEATAGGAPSEFAGLGEGEGD